MNIAMVSPYDFARPGGVNSHVAQLSAELRRRGHRVRVIAPQTGRPAATEGLPADNFTPMGRTVSLSAGGSTAQVSLAWWLYRKVRGLMTNEHFDVVHLHEPLAPLLPYLALHHSRAVNIGTFHAFAACRRLYRLSRPALQLWQRQLHGRIAVSAAARTFVSAHFPQHAYQVIPNGIDYRRFAAAPPLPHLKDGRVNLLFVGRKDKRKGLRYLLDAFRQMLTQRSDLRLIIVGPGAPDRDCARRLDAIAAAAPQSLLLTGAVTDADLPRYYASADVFCSPATGGESFGIVLAEAMAAGIPVVASDIDGYRDVVTHGAQGLLTPPEDPTALASALSRIITDPALAGRLADAGRQRAAQFCWQRVGADIEDYYRTCIAEAGARGQLG